MTNEQVNRIEDFLEGRMNPQEQKQFEQDIVTDQELAAAYETYRTVEKSMFNPKQFAREDAVKNTLSELGAEFFGTGSSATAGAADHTAQATNPRTGLPATVAPATGRISRMRFALAAAAVAAVCIAGSWYLWHERSDTQRQLTVNSSLPADTLAGQSSKPGPAPETPATPDTQGREKKNNEANRTPVRRVNRTVQKQLFAAYFQPDVLPENREGPLKTAFELYEKEEYKQAAGALEDAGLELSVRGEETDRKPARFYSAYYQALSYMATGEDARAIPLLKRLTAPRAGLQAKADWYLALCYVRRSPLPEAMLLLRKVSNNPEAGATKAAADRLMAELEKIQP